MFSSSSWALLLFRPMPSFSFVWPDWSQSPGAFLLFKTTLRFPSIHTRVSINSFHLFTYVMPFTQVFHFTSLQCPNVTKIFWGGFFSHFVLNVLIFNFTFPYGLPRCMSLCNPLEGNQFCHFSFLTLPLLQFFMTQGDLIDLPFLFFGMGIFNILVKGLMFFISCIMI